MSVIFSNVSQFSFTNSPKVVVVGGGIAGLTTAYHLQIAGMHVNLYEVCNRLGGRIFIAKIDGRIAELGAITSVRFSLV